MLIKLTPDQIAKYWAVIKPAVSNTLPPIALNEETMMVILQKLLMAEMQCWLSVRDEKDRKVIDALITTAFQYDAFSGTQSLLVYSLLTSKMTKTSWNEFVETLRKYAIGNNCSHLTAYTQNDMIVEAAKKSGAEVYNYLSIPLD